MLDRTRLRRNNKKKKISKTHKGQELVEDHNRPRSEVTRHIEEDFSFASSQAIRRL